MTIHQVMTFMLTCDGYKPNGQPCPCDLTVEAGSKTEAEARARMTGWSEGHNGWTCNAAGGHR